MHATGKVGLMPRASGPAVAGDGDGGATAYDTRMELIGRVAAGLAHDLNGPVGVMIGFTQLAREKLETGDPTATGSVVEYLKMIETAGENARCLARDMWNFATAPAGVIGEIDFAEVLGTSARLVAPSLRVAAIEPPGLADLGVQTIVADRAMWAQAVVGVMVDAPTALPGGGSLALTLTRSADESSLDVAFIATPSEPGASVLPSTPAQEWTCRDSTRAAVLGLGGNLQPMSGLGNNQRGLTITVPTNASGN